MRKIILAAAIAALATSAHAQIIQVKQQTVDDGSTAAVVVLLAIGAVIALSGGIGASASETRKDKAADEE